MAHTFTNLLVHLIFSTKGRTEWLYSDVRGEVHAYMGGIIREMMGKAIQIGGTKDHVHLLIRLSHALSLSELVRVLKTNSSRWIHREWSPMAGFAWQQGYGAFSVSESKVPIVCDYIARQEEHHKNLSFQEEFIDFLKKNGISYDERYIWE